MAEPKLVNAMSFAKNLSSKRKEKGLTQQALAELVGINVSQVHRYESGNTLPTFEVLKGIAIALNATVDSLVFDENERGPDDDLRLQFEAITKFSDEEKAVARSVLDGLILRHTARQLAS